MPLSTHVTNRIASQRLVELTNPGSTSATTVNTTLLGFATADVEADFRVFANITYDDADARHISAAVHGVVLKLLTWKGEGAFHEQLERWQTWLRDGLRMVTHNDRIRPESSSTLTPGPEGGETATIRPWFDGETGFQDFIPNAPQDVDISDRTLGLH